MVSARAALLPPFDDTVFMTSSFHSQFLVFSGALTGIFYIRIAHLLQPSIDG